MIFPTKFVEWKEVNDLSWLLAKKIKNSGWIPSTIVAVGRGGLVVARILSDLLGIDKLLAISIKWYEPAKKGWETYLADLIRAFYRSHENGIPLENEIANVVKNLRISISVEMRADLTNQSVLLVEEITATGMHFKVAKEIVGSWGAKEVKTATLVWKGPTVIEPDYYVVKPGRFVWFQFPWSRLNDYIQFIGVMTIEESRKRKRYTWSMDELAELFRVWYGMKPDPRYFEEALNVLNSHGVIKILDRNSVVIST
ncbi:phosphoribosyltransferase [Ignisphaera aggregans DSM 17230]|uniref:Phosphoribosyltransferase n=1 Tax=Ignisphaera aggregans (strain DSM 17230 / JCM 13409 / AQ1.S1) TaxID=583356 RepID=E0SNS5_IGNAA|nr:phosphoribosyltransferase [Ignisphaera aggregans DSM 17230]